MFGGGGYQDGDGGMLQQAGSGFAPISGGWQPRFTTGFEQFGATNPMLGMLLQSTVGPMLFQGGFMPFGNHSQNLYDYTQQYRFTQMQQQLLRQSAASDQAAFEQTFRGAANLMGIRQTPEVRQAIHDMAGGLTSMTPYLAPLFPDLIDTLAGPQGSNIILQQGLSLGGRYRIDPVTGSMGYSASSHTGLLQHLNKTLLPRDANGNLMPDAMGNVAGLSMGQVGMMYDELQRRGLGTSTPSLTQRTIDAAGIHMAGRDPANLGANELDALRNLPDVQERMKSMDFERVKTTIKTYASAVSAVRDLFGDMGKPNAPMAELMASLEALAQGSITQIDPNRLAGMVRMTHNLAKTTGVSIDAAMMMQQHAAVVATQMGLEPIFGVQAAQGSLAWTGALMGTQGLGNAWGTSSLEAQRQMNTNLRVAAAGSALANRLGSAARIGESIGGFAAGSMAGNLIDALNNGTGEFVDPSTGKTRNIGSLRDEGELIDAVVKGSGGRVSSQEAYAMLYQRGANREYVEKMGIGNVVKDYGQRYDTERVMQQQFALNFAKELTDRGMAPGKAQELAQKAAVKAADALMNAPRDQQTNNQLRDKLIGDAFNTATGQHLNAGIIGESAWGEFDQRGRMTFGMSGQDLLVQSSKTTLLQSEQLRREAKVTGDIQTALAPIGRGGLLRRFIGAIQNSDEKGTMTEVVEKMFGAESADVQRALIPIGTNIKAEIANIEAIRAKMDKATPAERVGLQKQIDAAMERLTAHSTTLHTLGLESGIASSENISNEDVRDAGANAARLGGLNYKKDPKEYTAAADRYATETSSMAGRAMSDEGLMLKLGKGGGETMQRAQDAGMTLKALADKHAGGDMGRLLAGDLDSKLSAEEKAQVMSQVTAARSSIDTAHSTLRGALAEGKKTPMSAADEAQVKLDAAEAKKRGEAAPGDVLKELSTAYGMKMSDEERNAMAEGLAKSGGTATAQSILATRKTLQHYASGGKGGSVADLIGEYRKSMGDGTLDDFRKKRGMDEKQFNEFSNAANLQMAYGFDDLGGKDEHGAVNDGTLFRDRLNHLGNNTVKGAAGAGGGLAKNMDINIKGEMTIKGDVVAIDGKGHGDVYA